MVYGRYAFRTHRTLRKSTIDCDTSNTTFDQGEKKKGGGKECAIHSNSVYHTEIRENENLDRTFLPAYVASRISVSYHID